MSFSLHKRAQKYPLYCKAMLFSEHKILPSRIFPKPITVNITIAVKVYRSKVKHCLCVRKAVTHPPATHAEQLLLQILIVHPRDNVNETTGLYSQLLDGTQQ